MILLARHLRQSVRACQVAPTAVLQAQTAPSATTALAQGPIHHAVHVNATVSHALVTESNLIVAVHAAAIVMNLRLARLLVKKNTHLQDVMVW